MKRWLLLACLSACSGCDTATAPDVPLETRLSPVGLAVPSQGIWMTREELALLPTRGPAWDRLLRAANATAGIPNVANQDEAVHKTVFAKALVYGRTGNERYRTEVRAACMAAIGTEVGGRTLALGRNLGAYVMAADLVGLQADEDVRFRAWLRTCLSEQLDGLTLRSTHERRPNNWGTHAGASRTAVAMYLGDPTEIARCARVFRGWLGDRAAYAGFSYGDPSWQADPLRPVGVNPAGATREGHSIDGVLPDDQRRSGTFVWPPPKENYVYEAMQGALVQAVLLERAGSRDVWKWQDAALLRAYEWLYRQASFPAASDDVWQLPIVDRHCGTHYWDGSAARPGKTLGWTDWTHALAQ